MSAYVKLSSKLEGDPEINGLDAYAPELLLNPTGLVVAVVWLDVKDIRKDTDTGAEVPTVRVRRIEPLGPASEQPKTLVKLVADAVQTRTGRTAIPFETAEIGEQAFSDPLDDQ